MCKSTIKYQLVNCWILESDKITLKILSGCSNGEAMGWRGAKFRVLGLYCRSIFSPALNDKKYVWNEWKIQFIHTETDLTKRYIFLFNFTIHIPTPTYYTSDSNSGICLVKLLYIWLRYLIWNCIALMFTNWKAFNTYLSQKYTGKRTPSTSNYP